MNKLISDLRNMVASSRHTGEPIDTERVAAAIAGYTQSYGSDLPSDKERLDYIERTFSGMTNRERYLPVTMVWGKGCNGRSLREACDKYMKRLEAEAAV